LGELNTPQTQFKGQFYQTVTAFPILSGLLQDFIKIVQYSSDAVSLELILHLQ